MNRQALLDNFIIATHGKGCSNAPGTANCLYFPDDHPGCAIGCQPGFKEQFKRRISEGCGVDDLCGIGSGRTALQRDVRAFFGVESKEDVVFLCCLQDLHDHQEHWTRRGAIRLPALRAFTTTHSLQIPDPKA